MLSNCSIVFSISLFFTHLKYCIIISSLLNLSLHSLKSPSLQTLAWASKLKVVTIFRTEVKHLRAGLMDGNSPIPKLLNCAENEVYPFDALADPDGRAAENFGCNTSSLFKTFKMNGKSAPKMAKRLLTSSIVRKEAYFAATHGAGNLLPSEFLVDKDGQLVDILRATKSNEHMSTDRISEFLIADAKAEYKKRRAQNDAPNPSLTSSMKTEETKPKSSKCLKRGNSTMF